MDGDRAGRGAIYVPAYTSAAAGFVVGIDVLMD